MSLKSAMDSRDPKAVAAHLAPGFQSVDVDGHIQSADQMVQQVAALPQDPNKVSETTILSVKQEGNSATVTQRYHLTTARTQADVSSSPQVIDLLATSTDTWVLSQDVWLLQRTQTDELEYKIDGKVVAHKERVTRS